MRNLNLGFKAIGFDGEPAQVAHVRQCGFEAINGDLERDLPYAASECDLVTCLEVIEHVARAEHLLHEIWRVLRPRGHLLLSTPNFAFWQWRLRYCRGQGPVQEGIHLRFFTRDTLRKTLCDAGFRVVRSGSFGPLTGVNFFRKRLGKGSSFSAVPRWAEAFLTQHFVYLCEKATEPGK